MTASLREIKVYTTFPHDCSYLDGREATTLFVDPRQKINQRLYTQLSLLGFRRSGDHVYRPHCDRCNACVPSRIDIAEFRLSRSQRRILNRNHDITVARSEHIFDDETYALYHRYIEQRHADGDMYPPDRDQYESFLNNGLGCTEYYRFSLGDQLVGVSVVDVMEDGLSAIYTFYDPDHERRSLGTFAVLHQLEEARRRALPYVYLGFWIEESPKMSYKSKFNALEILKGGEWRRLQASAADQDTTEPVRNLMLNR
ncbi:arginyltransferase [Luminiphilus syltensis NOR5-1B]|uniref:Aspartate/glutamate leucyltransferase n=1 Tax=Luminiphilus syltensis NOR5-1B TaxID=565045 RepID=B8KRL0_9GAMM|nr:arginyltransferase [Luminiphilus syltensis]EED35810.1 arginyltransferase [Luminiphilus syltensis NOR5-1B]